MKAPSVMKYGVESLRWAPQISAGGGASHRPAGHAGLVCLTCKLVIVRERAGDPKKRGESLK